VVNVPLTVALALLLATALNAAIPFRTFFRISYYVPYVTASVAVVGVWLFLFSSDGLVNHALGGLAPSPSWLINEHWAMPSIAIYVTWKQLGFFILLYLAALQNVPKELYEAAAVDGASKWRSFLSVTVPGVRRRRWSRCWRSSPARTCSPSRTCSPTAAVRTARRRRRCC
jgi:multiple sugar transport system permease protein